MADTLGLLFKITASTGQATSEIKGLSNTVSKEINQIKRISSDGFGSAEKSSLSMGAAFRTAGIGIAAVGTLAVAAAGSLYALVKSASDAGSEIYDASVKTGFAAESLSALKNATEASGGNFGSLSAALGIFQKNMIAAAQGNDKMSATFKALNIDTRDNEKALRQAFDVLSRMPAGAEKTAAAMALFGRSGKEVLGIIDDMNGNLDGAIEKYRAFGTLIGTDAAKAADKFGDQITELEQQFAGLSREIGMALMPALMETMRSVSDWVRNNKEEIKNFIVGTGQFIKDWILVPLRDAVVVLKETYEWLAMLPKMVSDIPAVTGPIAAARAKKQEQDNATAAMVRQIQGATEPGVGQGSFRESVTPHLPGLDGAGKGTKAKKVETDEDRATKLLADYRNEVERTKEAINDLLKTSSLQRTETKLGTVAYRDATETTKQFVLAEAKLLDISEAQLESKKTRIKAEEENEQKQKRAMDSLRNLIDAQTEAVRLLTEGERSNTYQLMESIAANERMNIVIADSVKYRAQLNALHLDWLNMMKVTASLMPSSAGMFGGAATPEAGTPEATTEFNRLMDTFGTELPPIMQGQMDLFDAFGQKLSDVFGFGAAGAQAFGDAVKGVFEGVTQAFGSMVYGFLMGEKLSGKAFMQMAKSAIAAVAAEAAVRALFELAMGLASLWLMPAKAAAHFAAAKLFGVVAAGAAVVSLAIPGGGSASQGGAAGSSLQSSVAGRSGGGTGPAVTPIDVGRRTSNEQAVGDLNIRIDMGDGHIENKMVRIFQSNGRLRTEMRRDLLGERSPM